MIKVKFLLASFIFSTLFLVFTQKNSFAQTATFSASPQASTSSYVLFYPVVAGKTQADSFYFLKLLRDRLIEMLTFTNEKKASVNLGIATKRLLEAEKLIKDNRDDLLKNTLSKFNTKLASAYDNAQNVKDSDFFPEIADEIARNSEKYITVLRQLRKDVQGNVAIEALDDSIKRVSEIQQKIQDDQDDIEIE